MRPLTMVNSWMTVKQRDSNTMARQRQGNKTDVLFWTDPASETACNGEFVDGNATAREHDGEATCYDGEVTRRISSSGQVQRVRWLAMVNLWTMAKQWQLNGKAT